MKEVAKDIPRAIVLIFYTAQTDQCSFDHVRLFGKSEEGRERKRGKRKEGWMERKKERENDRKRRKKKS